MPEKGVQPEVATDEKGTIHLVYLRGDAKASEVRYTSRKAGEAWQQSQTVNSVPGSAVAMGNIRGPQLAISQGGTVHVLWNGAATGKTGRSLLWYAQGAGNGAGFDPQHDLLGKATALDGGASMTADAKGRVFVVWHGNANDAKPEESKRLIFLRTSTNNGDSFGEAEAINPGAPGICACCSLRGTLDDKGEPNILVRVAPETESRAMTLYVRRQSQWVSREIEQWKIAACPMSSASLASSGPRLLGAWETAGQIRRGWLTREAPLTILTAASKEAKHPTLINNGKGRILLAWVEGSGWNRGGSACREVFDQDLQSTGERGRMEGVPPWGRVAGFASAAGDFVVLR